MRLLSFLTPLLFVLHGHAIEITEKNLVLFARKDVPSLDEIDSRMLESRANYQKALDGLGTEAYGAYNHQTTKERAINPFFPIYSPINQYKAGVKKATRYGVSADLSASVDQRSGSSDVQTFKDIHTTIYALTLNFDLWKDLFGKLTQKKLENAKVAMESAKVQQKIERKAFEVAVRRLYWGLVANNEKIEISKKLLAASKAQANDAARRQKASIADPGEVARYKAQVAQRNGALLYFKYEREQLLKSLKDLLPTLAGKPLKLGKYDLDQTLNNVVQCAAVINTQKDVPYKFTQYDEVAELLRTVQSNQKSIDQTYDDIDVSFSATYKQTGLGSDKVNDDFYEGSYDASLDDIRNNDRSGFEAGLFVNIPIGKKVSDTEEVIEKYNEKRLAAEIKNTETNVATTHRQISDSVKILNDVIKAQKQNNLQLGIRVREMRKQYRQARISVNALIQDEDDLANSSLSLVDTQLSVLNTLFDYFAVFTETPCSFNRIQ